MDVLLDGEQNEHENASLAVEEDHAKVSFVEINRLRSSRALCDVVIVVRGNGDDKKEEIYAHRVVLAARSLYFEAMFTSGMIESRLTRVEIKEIVDGPSLRRIVDFIYTGHLDVDAENAQALLSAAALLHVTAAERTCETFLAGHLDASNCLDVRAFAGSLACDRLVRECDRFFWENFDAVVAEYGFVAYDDDVDVVATMIGCDDLNASSEIDVFRAVMRWVRHDAKRRKTGLATLLARVRLPQLPVDYLIRVVEVEPLIRENLECRDLIDEAKNYHLSASCRFAAETTAEEKKERLRPRRSTVGNIYAVGGRGKKNEPYNSVEVYDFFRNQWTEVVSLSYRRRHVGVISMDGKVYAVGGHDGNDHLSSVECFDPKAGSWTEIEPMLTKRRGVAVATLGGPLYAVGGLNDTECFSVVERYNPYAREWTAVTSMQSPRGGVGLTELGGSLYAVGGNSGNASLDSVERYDPHIDTWIETKKMLVKRAGVGVTAAGGRIFAVGGFDDSSPLASGEAFDPREGVWSALPNLASARGGVGAVNFGGCWIAAVGGHDGDTYLGSVEIFDVYKNAWEPAADMLNCRAGAGVACS